MFNVILKSAFLIGGIILATKANGRLNVWQVALGSLKTDSKKINQRKS